MGEQPQYWTLVGTKPLRTGCGWQLAGEQFACMADSSQRPWCNALNPQGGEVTKALRLAAGGPPVLPQGMADAA